MYSASVPVKSTKVECIVKVIMTIMLIGDL